MRRSAGKCADGVLRGEVRGMEIVGHVFRLEVEEPREMRQVRLERVVREQVLEIARVRGHVGAPAARQGECVLELRAHCQNVARSGDGERQRLRRVAPSAADQALATGHDARDAVVVAGTDLAVVAQERVGDARQALEGFGVVRGQRLVGEIAARQHDRAARAPRAGGGAAACTGGRAQRGGSARRSARVRRQRRRRRAAGRPSGVRPAR